MFVLRNIFFINFVQGSMDYEPRGKDFRSRHEPHPLEIVFKESPGFDAESGLKNFTISSMYN